jgi:hypothetical protein
VARRTERIRWTASASRAISGSLDAVLVTLGLLGSVLIVSLAVPSAAAAETGPPSLSPPPGFELAGSNGYRVEVSGVAAQGGGGAEVVVRVAIRVKSVTYHFPGTVEEGSIDADLGPYGQISVAFHPMSGGMGGSEEGCSRGLSAISGYYEGTISFHAAGLTEVDASSAKGSIGLALNLLCSEESENEAPMPAVTRLEVSGKPTAPSLTILQRGGGGATQIEAGVAERRGGVAIERRVSIVALNSSFRHRGLRSATVSLPAPFSGSAIFLREGTRTSWRGNLRVDLPGRRGVALTGNGLRASMRRGPTAHESSRH